MFTEMKQYLLVLFSHCFSSLNLAVYRNFLLDVMTSTYSDLSLKRVFKSLVQQSAGMVEREEHYLTLLEDEARNRALVINFVLGCL